MRWPARAMAPTRWSAWATCCSSSTTPTTARASSPTCSAPKPRPGTSSCAPRRNSTRPGNTHWACSRPGRRARPSLFETAMRRQYADMFAALPEPAYLTYGNVDVPAMWERFTKPGHHVVDGGTAELDGWTFGFVGGGLKSVYRTPNEISDEEFRAKIEAVGEGDVLG